METKIYKPVYLMPNFNKFEFIKETRGPAHNICAWVGSLGRAGDQG